MHFWKTCVFNCSSSVCWIEYSFHIELPWNFFQKSVDHIGMSLFVDFYWSITTQYKTPTKILIGNEVIYRSIVGELTLIKLSLPIHKVILISSFTKVFCNFSEHCFVVLVHRFYTYSFVLNFSLTMSWFFNAIVNGIFFFNFKLFITSFRNTIVFVC